MKTFTLLELFPCTSKPDSNGFSMRVSGNRALSEVTTKNKDEAIRFFGERFPELNLNSNGYAQKNESSYCVAEQFSSISR